MVPKQIVKIMMMLNRNNEISILEINGPWPWTILSTKLLDVLFLHWSKKSENIPTLKREDADEEEAVECDTSGAPTPTIPLLPGISKTGRDTTNQRLLATYMSLSPTLQVRPLSQRGTTRPWHRPLLHSEMEPRPWSGFASFLRGKRLRQACGGLFWSLHQGPILYGHTGKPH